MDIAIIGAGRVGTALAAGWVKAGHHLLIGSRDSGKSIPGIRTLAPAEAAQSAEVVVLALPWPVAQSAVKGLGDLAGKIVIDCMNPLKMSETGMALTHGHVTSGGEMVQAWLPDAFVVKTLNQVGANVMADTSGFAHPPVQFFAGNDAAAKATAAGLLSDLGFEPIDAGDITAARMLEPFALVWIRQAFGGKGRDWAFAALPKLPVPPG